MSKDDFPDMTGGEYAVVRMPETWPVLSLLFFLAALAARFITSLIPPEAHVYRPFLTAMLVPILALAGLLCGLLGLRNPEGRSTARVALFLNAVTLVLGVLGIAAFYYIARR